MKSIKRSFPIPALVLSEVERIAKENGTTASFFVRQAIVEKLERETGNSFHNPQWGERTDLKRPSRNEANKAVDSVNARKANKSRKAA